MDNFGEVYERLGTHLRNAQQSYADADRKLDRARNSIDELTQGGPARKCSNPRLLRMTTERGHGL